MLFFFIQKVSLCWFLSARPAHSAPNFTVALVEERGLREGILLKSSVAVTNEKAL